MYQGSGVHDWGWSMDDRGNVLHNRSVDNRSGHSVDGRSALGDDSVESVDGVGGVVNSAHATIGLHQRVLTCGNKQLN